MDEVVIVNNAKKSSYGRPATLAMFDLPVLKAGDLPKLLGGGSGNPPKKNTIGDTSFFDKIGQIFYQASGSAKFDADMSSAMDNGASIGLAGWQAYFLNKQNELILGNGSGSPYASTTRLGSVASKGIIQLADDAIVVRGGTCKACQFENGSGVTVSSSGKLQGVSVNSANGASVQELSSTVKNGQIGTTTVGKVRALGGNVVSSPTRNNPAHATLFGLDKFQAENLFTPTVKTPR